jgi:hypothetical protein
MDHEIFNRTHNIESFNKVDDVYKTLELHKTEQEIVWMLKTLVINTDGTYKSIGKIIPDRYYLQVFAQLLEDENINYHILNNYFKNIEDENIVKIYNDRNHKYGIYNLVLNAICKIKIDPKICDTFTNFIDRFEDVLTFEEYVTLYHKVYNQNPKLFFVIPYEYQTEELCQKAFADDYNNVHHMRYDLQTRDMWITAVINDKENKDYVPDIFWDREFVQELIEKDPNYDFEFYRIRVHYPLIHWDLCRSIRVL